MIQKWNLKNLFQNVAETRKSTTDRTAPSNDRRPLEYIGDGLLGNAAALSRKLRDGRRLSQGHHFFGVTPLF